MLEPDSTPGVANNDHDKEGVDVSEAELRVSHEFAAGLRGMVDAVDLEGTP